MIYTYLMGGLGNQMFIYAFARTMGLRHSEPVTLIAAHYHFDPSARSSVHLGLNSLNICPDITIKEDTGGGISNP